MKRVLAGGVAVALAACAGGTSVQRDGPGFIGGESGDLRVLVNDMCPQAYGDGADKGIGIRGLGGVAEQILASLGGVAFQSFGTYLKKAGQPNITRSTGSNGGQFYAGPVYSRTREISPHMRCIYLVRNGFGPQRSEYARNTPEDLRQQWRALGLTRTPDLFVALHIETAAEASASAAMSGVMFEGMSKSTEDRPSMDGSNLGEEGGVSSEPPYFRARLDRVYLTEFQSGASASATRDLAIVLNYGLASSQAAIQVAGANAGVTELVGKFAVGGIRIAGVRPGDYRAENLVSLQSAWMGMPPVKPFDPRATVDLSVYVVESAPGNPFLEEIGAYLASEQVAQSVTDALSQEISR